jgi:hypothetical protein
MQIVREKEMELKYCERQQNEQLEALGKLVASNAFRGDKIAQLREDVYDFKQREVASYENESADFVHLLEGGKNDRFKLVLLFHLPLTADYIIVAASVIASTLEADLPYFSSLNQNQQVELQLVKEAVEASIKQHECDKLKLEALLLEQELQEQQLAVSFAGEGDHART